MASSKQIQQGKLETNFSCGLDAAGKDLVALE
jgi:hypothetical protein